MDMEAIRVLIVDDHPMVRRGLRSLLSSYPDIQIVGEADDGETALQAAATLSPQVILLDIRLPGPTGVEVAYQLRHHVPEAKIIILTAYDNDEYVLGALRAGVSAYLLKHASEDVVVEAIRLVHQGQRLLSPPLVTKVLCEFEALAKTYARHTSGLSEDELKVLRLIAEGATNARIAKAIFQSERTVKRTITRLMDKLGARNRAQVVAEAVKRGLI